MCFILRQPTCEKNEDCIDHPWFECGIEKEGYCGHKGVLPVFGLEVGGIIVFAIIMALSNIAGIGGGGIAVPVLIAFFYFSTKTAIAISSFSIFLTTLARFIMNFKERHPEKQNVVVIDYDLVCIMMPTNLAGAQIGALILVTFPSIIIQILLTITLLGLAIQSVFKGIELTKKENREKQEAMKVNPAPEAADPAAGEDAQGVEMSSSAVGDNNQSARPILQPITDEVGSNHTDRSAGNNAATKTTPQAAVTSSAEK